MSALIRLGASLALILVGTLILLEIPQHVNVSGTGFAIKQSITRTPSPKIGFLPAEHSTANDYSTPAVPSRRT